MLTGAGLLVLGALVNGLGISNRQAMTPESEEPPS
jgi:hypothetical protein